MDLAKLLVDVAVAPARVGLLAALAPLPATTRCPTNLDACCPCGRSTGIWSQLCR